MRLLTGLIMIFIGFFFFVGGYQSIVESLGIEPTLEVDMSSDDEQIIDLMRITIGMLFTFLPLLIGFFLLKEKVIYEGKTSNHGQLDLKLYFKDVFCGMNYIIFHSRVMQIIYSLLLVIIFGVVFKGYLSTESELSIIILKSIGSVINVIFIFFPLILIIISLLSLPKLNKELYLPEKLEVSDQNMSIKSDVSSSEVSWKALYNLKASRQYIYIYLSHMKAIIIPKRVFNSENEMLSFYNQIRELWQKAKDQL